VAVDITVINLRNKKNCKVWQLPDFFHLNKLSFLFYLSKNSNYFFSAKSC